MNSIIKARRDVDKATKAKQKKAAGTLNEDNSQTDGLQAGMMNRDGAQTNVIKGTRYKMPHLYAHVIEQLVQMNTGISVAEVQKQLMLRLNISEGEKPEDFPAPDRVKNKVNNIKRKFRMANGSKC